MTQKWYGLTEIYSSDSFIFATEHPTILFKQIEPLLRHVCQYSRTDLHLVWAACTNGSLTTRKREELHYHPYLGSMCEHFL